MKRNKWKGMKIVLNPYVVCGILTFIGVLLIIISSIDFVNPWVWWSAWGCKAVNSIATTMIGSAVVSVVLEMSNLRDFVGKALENILGDDFPLNAYSEENLDNFHNMLIANTCSRQIEKGTMSKEKIGKTIYSLEPQIRDSITDIYYEYHKSKYAITPDEKNGVFKVEAHLEYMIVNEFNLPNEVDFKTKTYFIDSHITTDPNFEAFKIVKFKINDKPVRDYEFNTSPIEQASAQYYDYKVSIRKSLQKTVKHNKVELDYIYYFPMYDTTQSYKVKHPCKRVEHRFRIYPDTTTKKIWFLHADAFMAYYCNQKNQEKYVVEQNEGDLVKIDFKDWAFPGSGYVVSMKHKE